MENSYNWYYETFISKMKENNLLPQDMVVDNTTKEVQNIYFDSFIKYSIDNGALPAVKSTESKELEDYDAYFDAFVKNSIQMGLFAPNDHGNFAPKNIDFDAYFTTSIKQSLIDIDKQKPTYTNDELVQAGNIYFDMFSKNYKKGENTTALSEKNPNGQNIYFEVFLQAKK